MIAIDAPFSITRSTPRSAWTRLSPITYVRSIPRISISGGTIQNAPIFRVARRQALDLGDQLIAGLEVALEHLRRRAVGEAGLTSTIFGLPSTSFHTGFLSPAAHPAAARGAASSRRAAGAAAAAARPPASRADAAPSRRHRRRPRCPSRAADPLPPPNFSKIAII